mgnify:FL=1
MQAVVGEAACEQDRAENVPALPLADIVQDKGRWNGGCGQLGREWERFARWWSAVPCRGAVHEFGAKGWCVVRILCGKGSGSADNPSRLARPGSVASDQLDGNRRRLTTTNAQRGDTTLAAGLLQGVDQGDDQA